jgi:NitT/TauT family transport system permease protein
MGAAAESLPTGARGRLLRRLPSASLLLAIIVVWEGAKALFAIPTYQLPHVHDILSVFISRGGSGHYWILLIARSVAYTAWEALVGFVLGGAGGLALAVAFAYSRLLERGLLPYVVASQTVPILAIAPMIIVWLGPASWLSKAMIAAYLTFFPVTINTLRGLQSPEPTALELMRSYASSRWATLWKVQVPSALPYVFTALKVSATASVIGAIVGELPASLNAGLGRALLSFSYFFATGPEKVYGAVVVAGLLGMLFVGAVTLVERLTLSRWHRDTA